MAVNRTEEVDDVFLDGVVELIEAVDGWEPAVLPNLGVGGQAVISPRLNDGRDLVNPEI